MLRIDFKRFFWNNMIGQEAFGYTFMVINKNNVRFIRSKIPAGKDKYLIHMHGRWVRNTESLVESFNRQRKP